MEKELREKLLKKELIVQREIYMCELYNNYVKLLYKKIELWFIRKKLCIIKKKRKGRYKHGKVRKRR